MFPGTHQDPARPSLDPPTPTRFFLSNAERARCSRKLFPVTPTPMRPSSLTQFRQPRPSPNIVRLRRICLEKPRPQIQEPHGNACGTSSRNLPRGPRYAHSLRGTCSPRHTFQEPQWKAARSSTPERSQKTGRQSRNAPRMPRVRHSFETVRTHTQRRWETSRKDRRKTPGRRTPRSRETLKDPAPEPNRTAHLSLPEPPASAAGRPARTTTEARPRSSPRRPPWRRA